MTRAELVAVYRTRAADAEKIGATAPLAHVYQVLVAELEDLSGVPAVPEPDRLLTLQETAQRLAVPVRWLREPHTPPLPFLRKLGARTMRVSERALQRWMETRAV